VIVSAIENFVFFSTLLAILGFAVAWPAHVLSSGGQWNCRPERLTRLYTITLVAPPVIAAWLVIAALLPEWWLGEIAFDAAHVIPHHGLHLFRNLTAKFEPVLAYMTLLFIGSAVIFTAWSSWRTHARVGRLIGQLQTEAEIPSPQQVALVEECARRYGFHVGLVMSSYPFSFLWGFHQSHLILSTGLLRELAAAELKGVLEHEAAHHARRDNLVKLILSLCAYSSLAVLLSRLSLRWRALEVEMICDEVAVSRTRGPLEIADALVKLGRQRSARCVPAQASIGSGFVSEDLSDFERRVHRLLEFVDAPPAPKHAMLIHLDKGRLVASAAVFTTTIVLLTYLSPLAIHKAAETLIQFIK
jgi:Zn-dependent protease with chaperone function